MRLFKDIALILVTIVLIITIYIDNKSKSNTQLMMSYKYGRTTMDGYLIDLPEEIIITDSTDILRASVDKVNHSVYIYFDNPRNHH